MPPPHLTHLVQSAGLTPAEAAQVAALFQPVVLPRNQVWVDRDSLRGDIGLVETGLMCYFLHRDGDELANYLAPAGALVASLPSLLHGAPSRERIVALTETRLWVAPQAHFLHLVHTLPNGWRMLAQLLAYQIGCMEDARRDALLLSAGERYRKLLAQEPHLVHLAALHHIAQLLGITPQHLSRIRRQMAQTDAATGRQHR